MVSTLVFDEAVLYLHRQVHSIQLHWYDHCRYVNSRSTPVRDH